jgi:acetyl-CoA acetyltransferase
MKHVSVCDGIQTPIGRYGGALAAVRADHLAPLPIQTLLPCSECSPPCASA